LLPEAVEHAAEVNDHELKDLSLIAGAKDFCLCCHFQVDSETHLISSLVVSGVYFHVSKADGA
jgi:hypothetical protein